MSWWQRLRHKLSIPADLRDGAGGWVNAAERGAAERPNAERLAQYRDALDAWRTSPYAKRIIDLITDYTVGDGITPIGPRSVASSSATA